MNTTINVSNPLDTIQIIVRYDNNNNQIHKISFFYEEELQLILSQDSFDVTLGDKIPPKHITAAKEFMRTCNAPGANITPTKTLYDIISHNCMMTELLVHTHKPDFKWDCASPYMYDYVQYQDIIKAELGEPYPIDQFIGIQPNAPENQTCYMNVLKGRPEHSRFNMTYDRDLMEHITPEAIQTLFDHINKE